MGAVSGCELLSAGARAARCASLRGWGERCVSGAISVMLSAEVLKPLKRGKVECQRPTTLPKALKERNKCTRAALTCAVFMLSN
jgi:hypothetical protein